MDYPVALSLLPIPDGFDDAGNLRLTVHVSPRATEGDDPVNLVDLASWPSAIAKLAQSLHLTINSSKQVACSSLLSGFFQNQPSTPVQGAPTVADLADMQWRSIFAAAPSLADLHAVLAHPSHGGSPSGGGTVISTHTSDLSVILRAITEATDGNAQGSKTTPTELNDPKAAFLKLWIERFEEDPRVGSPRYPAGHGPARATGWKDRTSSVAAAAAAVRSHLTGSSVAIDPDHWSTLKLVIGNVVHGLGLREPGRSADGHPWRDELEPHHWTEAKRKLQWIDSIPSLSHYLGLAIQVTCSPADFQGSNDGEVSISFDQQIAQRCGTTAFSYVARTELDGGHFGPADDPKRHVGTSFGITRGNVILTEGGLDQPRFMLTTIDAINMFLRLLQALVFRGQASATHWETLRRGIVLLDRAKADSSQHEMMVESISGLAEDDPAKIYYAQDLMIGIRPDIGIAPHGRPQLLLDADRWRPLVARKVICEGPYIEKSFYEEQAIKGIAHHDHGLALTPDRVADPTRGLFAVEEELFSWAGASLGISATRNDLPKGEILGMTIRYEPVVEPANERMPPLREGRGYVVGCRAVYLNGAGTTFSAARAQYQRDASIVLGGEHGPLAFPACSLSSCGVHLLANDPLVTKKNTDSTCSESALRMVIRDSGSDSDQRIRRRLLLPPRTVFDAAELEGQFDDASQAKLATPPGIGQADHDCHLLTFSRGGELPEARGGKLFYRDDADTDNERQIVDIVTGQAVLLEDAGSPRGTVVMYGTHKKSSKTPYYASTHGRVIQPSIAWLTSDARPGSKLEPVEFWSSAERPSDARPVVVSISEGSLNKASITTVKWFGMNLPMVHVEMKPASTARLELATVEESNGERRIGRSQYVELVHAVRKPLAAPSLTSSIPRSSLPFSLGIRSITIVDTPSDEDHPNGSWAGYVQRNSGADEMTWISEAGGNTTYFVGGLAIHRASTGKLEVTLSWDEFDQSRFVLDKDGQDASSIHRGHKSWVQCRKPMSQKAFEVEVESFGHPDAIHLLCPEGSALTPSSGPTLRSLHCRFRDGRARRLKLSVRAASRFVNCYPENDEPDDHACSSDLGDIWTSSTFRPPPPAILTIDSSFACISYKKQTQGRRLISRAHKRLRIHLHEGWYASGEGEKLGIILKPADVDEDSIPLGHCQYLSRFGKDPTRGGDYSGRGYLSANQVVGAKLAPGVGIPVTKDAFDGESRSQSRHEAPAMVMDVATLAPFVDEVTGGLVCDLVLNDVPANAPLLHLGLVRFQEHSAVGLSSSTPIKHSFALQPLRTVTVTTGKEGTNPNDAKYYRSVHVEAPEQTRSAIVSRELDLRLVTRVDHYHHWQEYRGTIDEDTWPKKGVSLDQTGSSYGVSLKLLRAGAPFMGMIIEEYELLRLDDAAFSTEDSGSIYRRLCYSAFVPLGRFGEPTW